MIDPTKVAGVGVGIQGSDPQLIATYIMLTIIILLACVFVGTWCGRWINRK